MVNKDINNNHQDSLNDKMADFYFPRIDECTWVSVAEDDATTIKHNL